MEGVEGVLVRRNNGARFVITLELINLHAAIELEAQELEPLAVRPARDDPENPEATQRTKSAPPPVAFLTRQMRARPVFFALSNVWLIANAARFIPYRIAKLGRARDAMALRSSEGSSNHRSRSCLVP